MQLMSVFLSLIQAPVYTARPRTQYGACITQRACLRPSGA